MKEHTLALTSVTFRSLGVDQVIALAKEAGLDGIEWGGDIHVPMGDLSAARIAGEKTSAAGLSVLSYGSYFTLGADGHGTEYFQTVLETAAVLGAPVVRIWARKTPSAECAEDLFLTDVSALKEYAAMARDHGIRIGIEFHNGTYNDTAESSLRLLNAVGAPNLRTYWQPIHPYERNLKDIKKLALHIENVHVYNWIYGERTVRKMLFENAGDWKEYIALIGTRPYVLEFAKDDLSKNFLQDAKTLHELVGE